MTDEVPPAAGGRRLVLARNGFATIIRAASGSAINVVLPLVLVSLLTPDEYATWALAFSIAGYVLFFDLGIPSTVQVFVAKLAKSGRLKAASGAALSGTRITLVVGAAFALVTVPLGLNFAVLSSAVPSALAGDAGAALVLFSVGQAANLVTNTASAYFSGVQRSARATVMIVPVRLVSLVAVSTVAIMGRSLLAIAVAFTIPLLAGPLLLIWSMLRETKTSDILQDHAPVPATRMILEYSAPLALWGVCMLLATGSGVAIVGRIAPGDLYAYSIAAVVYTAFVGLMGAVVAPLLPEFSRRDMRGISSLRRSVIPATRVYSALLFTIVSLSMAVLPLYLQYVSASSLDPATGLLTSVLLLLGGAVHLAATPISYAFVSAGVHHQVIAAPVVEALVTIGAGVFLGGMYGAVGMASAVLIGALGGLAVNTFWSIRRLDGDTEVGALVFFWSVLMPAPGALIVATGVAILYLLRAPGAIAASVTLALLATSLVWQYRVVLPAAERARLMEALRNFITLRLSPGRSTNAH